MPEIKPLQKVLIANRGEIAVRVIRACKDAGIGSVAVYAEPDRDAVFVRLADEAHSLGGATPADSYLDIAKIIAVAEKTGADSVHPGYGFLAENAGFAQAVIDAGLTWIGPPPSAIENLGDKAKAKHIAEKADAPLAPGTKDAVKDADEVVSFAKANGLPVAIKAVFGGGGRGLKVARTLEEIPELYESAVREAVGAFGRGDDLLDVEVGVGRGGAVERVGLVGEPDEDGVAVGLGVHRDAADAGVLAGTDHADRDLATVGDQHLLQWCDVG